MLGVVPVFNAIEEITELTTQVASLSKPQDATPGNSSAPELACTTASEQKPVPLRERVFAQRRRQYRPSLCHSMIKPQLTQEP
jgi:hypothetical protein